MLRSRLRATVAIAFVFCAAAMPVRALAQGEASPDSLKAANELMALMSKDTVQQLVTSLTAQIWPTLERALRAKRSDIDQATLTELRHEFERIQGQYMTGVMADTPAIYARYFSAQELRDMLAFYATPTGQKTLQVMPQLTAEVFQLIMQQMLGLQAQIMDAFGNVLRQRGIEL
ncbi:MAG: DUF2059 domain-containing protein [Xanthobacteraceae bacterium]|nr:DUF2059 domain-containing protein [Xanthobacteraceae bacterium]